MLHLPRPRNEKRLKKRTTRDPAISSVLKLSVYLDSIAVTHEFEHFDKKAITQPYPTARGCALRSARHELLVAVQVPLVDFELERVSEGNLQQGLTIVVILILEITSKTMLTTIHLSKNYWACPLVLPFCRCSLIMTSYALMELAVFGINSVQSSLAAEREFTIPFPSSLVTHSKFERSDPVLWKRDGVPAAKSPR